MERRISYLVLSWIICMLFSVYAVQALTASIGNSRAIVHAEVGNVLERSILIKNVNDVDVRVTLDPAGDLENDFTFEDNNFTLSAHQDRELRYTLRVSKSGTTETKINVAFTPPEGSGVGIAATLIVVASENGEGSENTSGDTIEDVPGTGGNAFGISFSPLVMLAGVTGLLIVILAILILYAVRFRRKKRAGRPRA